MLAALFVRALRHAGATDPGFDPRGVDIATLDASVIGVTGPAPDAFWRTVIDRVRKTPAVERASLARVPPGGFEGIGLGGVAPGDQPTWTEMVSPAWNIVDTDYFATLHIPVVAGRDFAATDTAGAPLVVVVSETLARRFWPRQPAIGKPLRLEVFNARAGRVEPHVGTIVGVAGDIRSSSLIDGLAEPYVYLPLAQSDAVGSEMTAQMSIVARRRAGTSLVPTMATLVQDIDRRLVVASAQPLADSIALGLTPQRMLATICGVMGCVALLLASMGIYGVTAYTVALRRRELAIRLALGAPRGHVVLMVFRQGTWLVALALALVSRWRLASGRSFPSSSMDSPPLTCRPFSGQWRSSLPSAWRHPSCRPGRPSATDGCARFSRTERHTVDESRRLDLVRVPRTTQSTPLPGCRPRPALISEHQAGAELHRPRRARQRPDAHEIRIRERGDRSAPLRVVEHVL